MNDQSNKAGTSNTTISGSEQHATGARSKTPSQDHAEAQATDATTTLSISLPNATVRLIRIMAAASDSSVGKTIATLLASAAEREMPAIIRGLQSK
mgnify:CR=1 FL=1